MAVAITMSNFSSLSLQHYNVPALQFCDSTSTIFTKKNGKFNRSMRFKLPLILCCSESTMTSITEAQAAKTQSPAAAPVRRTRIRYRKQYPGEKNGITEEIRFVAMRLRNNSKPKMRRRIRTSTSNSGSESDSFDDDERENYDSDGDDNEASISDGNDDGEKETWQPSMEGFVKYLVDSKLVFDFIERIVDESSDVSCNTTQKCNMSTNFSSQTKL